MIAAKNIRFSYNTDAIFQYPDFYCEVSEPLLVRGKPGSGKTTLMYILGGILKPKTGGVFIDNISLKKLSDRKLDTFRGKNIGIINQHCHFISALSVLDNILLSQYFSGNKMIPEKAKKIARQLIIDHLLNKLPSELSPEEQQRVSIARALVNEPKVLLADEPTISLDDYKCDSTIRLLKEQSLFIGATLIIFSNDARVQNQFTKSIDLI